MYVSASLYDSYAQYINYSGTNVEFIRDTIKQAIKVYESSAIEDYDEPMITKIKSTATPVLYGSRVSKFDIKKDAILPRKEMNTRLQRRYLMIDADFDEGQEDESLELRNKLINLADEYNTYLIIYPTISFPVKPRFRAALFCKSVLNENSYYKAMTWLYAVLQMEPLDSNDLNIKSSNNLPVFINNEQVEAIYDNSQDSDRDVLNNSLWARVPGKPRRSASKVAAQDDMFSNFIISDSVYITGAQLAAPLIKTQQQFWMTGESIARAQVLGQISEELALLLVNILASSAPDDDTRLKWEANNKILYQKYVYDLSHGGLENKSAFVNQLLSRPGFNDALVDGLSNGNVTVGGAQNES